MSKIKANIFDARFNLAVTSAVKIPDWKEPEIEGKRWKLVAIVPNKSTTCVCGASIDVQFCIFQRSDGLILAPVGTDCAKHLGYTDWERLSLVYGVDVSGFKPHWTVSPEWFETAVGKTWVESVRRKCNVCNEYLWTRAAIKEHNKSEDHARIARGFVRRACVECGELLSVEDTERTRYSRCYPCYLYCDREKKLLAEQEKRAAAPIVKRPKPEEKNKKKDDDDGECELE